MNWDRLRARFEDWIDLFKRNWTRLGVPIAIALIAGFFVSSPFKRELPAYELGEIARTDIRAPFDIIFVDEDETKRRQDAAEDAVLRVFDVDPSIANRNLNRLRIAFQSARSKAAEGNLDREQFQRELGVSLGDGLWQSLTESSFSRSVERGAKELVDSAFEAWIYDDSLFEPSSRPRVILRDILSEEEQVVDLEYLQNEYLSLDQAQQLIRSSRARQLNTLDSQQAQTATELASLLLSANISLNRAETNLRREEARTKVERVVEELSKGQMIVREGDKIEARHIDLITRLRASQREGGNLKDFSGFVGLSLLLIFLFHWVGTKNFRRFRLSTRDRLVLGGFFVASLAVMTALYSLFNSFETESNLSLPLKSLLPLAFAGMTLRLFASMEITAFFVLLFSLCMAWMTQNPYFGLTALIVGMSGAASMRHISQRLDVLRAGLFAGAIQAACVLLGAVMGLLPSGGLSPWFFDWSVMVSLSLLAGLMSAGLVLFSQPLIEFLGYTTDLRLMELSSTNHPLLKEMIIKAPGTYFHSFTVSQLSEKAAEAINANPLFARVASLYHDVGKLKKPQYFIENIKGENRHDKMVPSMSALIISNHVKDGIELAHQHKLPQAIIDCIPQHHGTALISYFYDKAKKSAEEESEVDERDYRYPGPKPQTKEAAIIMMADAVEASSKSLAKASVDQLRQQVNATIRRFFLDGQLDECDLSLKDLNGIGNAFVSVLQGVYHQRIDYPHLKKAAQSDEETKSLATKTAGSDSV